MSKIELFPPPKPSATFLEMKGMLEKNQLDISKALGIPPEFFSELENPDVQSFAE